MNIIPYFTSVIAFIFTALLLRQFIQRRKIHQLLWTLALLFYGISTFMEMLMNPEILGLNNAFIFGVFYITATSLVGFLGAGQLYLVVKHKFSHVFLAFVAIFSVALLLALSFTPFPTGLSFAADLGENLRIVSSAYPISVRIYAIVLASVGGIVLLVGSIFSFIKDRSRYYALLFTLGAIILMFRNIPFGYLGNELAGVISLLIGYLWSILYIKKQNSETTD